MIEVRSYVNDERWDTAEADSPEAALLAARTLWDEAFTGIQGSRRQITFVVDDRPVTTVTRRP